MGARTPISGLDQAAETALGPALRGDKEKVPVGPNGRRQLRRISPSPAIDEPRQLRRGHLLHGTSVRWPKGPRLETGPEASEGRLHLFEAPGHDLDPRRDR